MSNAPSQGFDEGSADLRGRLIAMCSLLILANLGVWGWAFYLFHQKPVLLATAFLACSGSALTPRQKQYCKHAPQNKPAPAGAGACGACLQYCSFAELCRSLIILGAGRPWSSDRIARFAGQPRNVRLRSLMVSRGENWLNPRQTRICRGSLCG
jgi:hypothetical protein